MMQNKTIGVIAAMQIEIDALKEKLEDAKVETFSGIEFVSGTLYKKNVVCAKCGIGKVFAALCTQTMILKYKPDLIVNTGVAGGLAEGLSILDIVVCESCVQHDMDTSPLGDPVGLISGINIVNIPANEEICETLCKSVEAIGIKCQRGVIATGDQFVATEEKREFLKSTFNAAACEMEGASVGHVCYVNEVPFGIVRAISDGGDSAAEMDYPTFAALAAENSVRAMEKFIEII